MQLSVKQLEAIAGARGLINSAKPEIYKISGSAGSGKTTIIRHIIQDNQNVLTGSYCGKAVDVLRNKGIRNATTLHRMLYEYDDVTDRFVKKSRDYFGFVDAFILEEASMIPNWILNDVRVHNKPIIAVGDGHQLEPIDKDDAELMLKPDIVLEQIFRYEGSLAWFANNVRLGQIPRIGDYGAVKVKSKNDFLTDVSAVSDWNNTTVLCSYNRTRVAVNKYVRKNLGRFENLVKNENLICLSNNYTLGVFNGQSLRIVELIKGHRHPKYGEYTEAMVQFDDGNQSKLMLWHGNLHEEKAVDRKNAPLNMVVVDYDYCRTTHKSQGWETRNVLVIDEQSNLWCPIRHRYTSYTRAQENLTVYVD